jgi:hypothetical protein
LEKLWGKSFEELQDFIQEHPQVLIKEELVSIDEKLRPDFYKKFNKVRASFLAEKFSEWLDEAQFLCTKYMKAEDHLSERLHIQRLLMPVDLERFLKDPMKQAIRELFDPLFELLQEKIEPEEFEEKGIQTIGESFRSLYQSGYIKWFVLSLIQRLDPEKVYEIPVPQPSSKEIIKHRKDFRQAIPFPEETNILGFEVGRRDVLLIPDFIVRSALLGKYVAFRTEIGKAIWQAAYRSENREWLSIESIVNKYGISDLSPDLLLYVDENVEDISLVADCDQFCRPDMVIHFLDQLEDQEERDIQKVEGIKLAHDILNPVRGTCVISKHHLPDNLVKGLNENIHFIHFGFNNLKWEILSDLLKG